MKRKIFFLSLVLLLPAAAGLFAAQAPRMVIEYFESNSGAMYVRTAGGKEIEAADLSFGDELPVGATLITMKGDFAELRLVPNGTIVRVAENTNFTVSSVQGRDGAAKNVFAVAVGKIKTAAAKGKGFEYSFGGATAVCGVRGTKFIFSVLPGQKELAYVIEGLVDFTNAGGQTLSLGAGMAADALAASFATFTPPQDLLDDLQAGTEFQKLSEAEVPQGEAEAPPAPEAPKAEQPAEAKSKTPKWLERVMGFLGMEIGTVTIEGETWAKAIVQPHFAFGKLRMGLYLPVIYKTDLFNPGEYYRPAGNDEWSFGTDQATWQQGVLDAVDDLFLKIRYVEWGEQRDPFFFKVGNLNDITIGHGSIMRAYANDAEFPAVRKIGLNLGLRGKKGGLEAMVSDAADPQIFGLRGYFNLVGPLALGLTALTDLNPERVAWGDVSAYGKPIFLNGGLDLEYPIVEQDSLKVIPYLDAAAMVPYFREALTTPPAPPVPGLKTPGLAIEAFWPGSWPPKNWGLMAGVLGNISVIDYRLEFRYTDGTFRPSFYDELYDRLSKDYVIDLVTYLSDPGNPKYDVQTMGVYGELGYTLKRVFYITGGYYWPWPTDLNVARTYDLWPDDTLHLEFGILKGLLPLYGSISMYRKGIVAPLLNTGQLDFFDQNLLFSGEIVYPFSPIMEFALQVTTNVFGSKVYPSVSILTRLNS
jgi:hypothetical protein